MCRCAFDEIEALPDPEQDVENWFRLVDTGGTGRLSKVEVRDVFAATLDVDQASLDEVIAARWNEWDTDGTGDIAKAKVPYRPKAR